MSRTPFIRPASSGFAGPKAANARSGQGRGFFRPKPLGDMVDACIAPALAAQGFAAADIIVAWGDIVGERLAVHTQPLRIEWPRRAPGGDGRADPATLVVRCTSAFALELQHTATVVVERVNTHFGWRCIGRIVIRQGPVRRVAHRPAPPVATEAEKQRVRDVTGAVDDPSLRDALTRLGEAIAAKKHTAKV